MRKINFYNNYIASISVADDSGLRDYYLRLTGDDLKLICSLSKVTEPLLFQDVVPTLSDGARQVHCPGVGVVIEKMEPAVTFGLCSVCVLGYPSHYV